MTAASRDNQPEISAVIITRDAGRHLAAVLAALDFCAERLVLDSGSADDTVAIAAAAGARVEHQPFLGYGPQKARAITLASHDWILSIDADEVLDGTAAAAIRGLDLADPAACWSLRRRTFVGSREILHGPWQNDRVLRLFNRTRAGFRPLVVHEQVEPPSPPSAKATSTAPLAEITWVIWGASGTVEGTPGSALLAVPGPRLLTARIATE